MSEREIKFYGLWLITAAICLLIAASMGLSEGVPVFGTKR